MERQTNAQVHAHHAEQRIGVVCGLSAHFLWGVFPIYIKMVSNVPSIQVLAHRIAWSVVVVAIINFIRGGWGELRAVVGDRRAMLMLAGSTLAISTNWFLFIYAINSGKTLESSLGYFISPLLSVVLGMTILGERMRKWQTVSLILATVGVVYLTWLHGIVPWIALTLAGTFCIYSLLRKTVRAGAVTGLAVETAYLLVPALVAIAIYHTKGHTYDQRTWLLLPFAGVVTAVPYLLFAAAARRLRLMTMGFLQYVTPTCHFLLAVFAFGEPIASRDLISFGLIWIALVIYSWDSIRAYRAGINRVPQMASLSP